MYRSQVYNESRFFRVTPIGRFDVVPGQSVDLETAVRLRTPNFINPVLSGGLAVVATFYVPYRLLWNGWVDFVTERVGNTGNNQSATVPTSAVSSPFLLERRSSQKNTFGRRAYKLIYNQFFGDKDMGEYYPTITDDADVSTPHGARALEQLLSKLVMTGSITEQTFSIDTSGATAAIPLNQFHHALVTARQMKRRDMTGNKYVDALLSMGVKLDWRVQQAPELLALHKQEFGAQVTAAQNKQTTDTDQTLGQFSTYYDFQMKHRTGRKFFAEHGVVMTVAVLRPHVFHETAAGSYFQNMTDYDLFFWGDNVGGKTSATPGNILGSVSGSSAQLPFMQWYESGQNIMGAHGQQPWVMSKDTAVPSIDDLVYPTVDRVQVKANVGNGTQFVAYAQHQAVMQTPIPKGVNRI